MAPVLTMSSTNYDYDYDTIQPLFFLDGEEEDFYPPLRSHLLPGPDIWKKFELLPTPPLSPSRSPPQSEVPLSATDHLEAVSDLLDDECNPSAALLQSFVIQDCMWSSSFSAATKLEKVVSERLELLRARQDSCSTTTNANPTTEGAADQQGTRPDVNTGYLQDLHAAATDCIDPSVVFPYTTLSKKSGGGAAMEVASELCLDSPPLSSSDSESGGSRLLFWRVTSFFLYFKLAQHKDDLWFLWWKICHLNLQFICCNSCLFYSLKGHSVSWAQFCHNGSEKRSVHTTYTRLFSLFSQKKKKLRMRRLTWWRWTGERFLLGRPRPTSPCSPWNAPTSPSSSTITPPSSRLHPTNSLPSNGWSLRSCARPWGRAAAAGAGARGQMARTAKTDAGLTTCWSGRDATSWRWASWRWGTRSRLWPTTTKLLKWWSWRRRRSSSRSWERTSGGCWGRRTSWGRGAESWDTGWSSSGLYINSSFLVSEVSNCNSW